MKKIIFFICYIFSLSGVNYHDIIINGQTVAQGAYSCIKRYKSFKPILDKFKRNFTVLDIGAAQGCFSLKVAYDYPNSTNVMIEGGYVNSSSMITWPDYLLDICSKNNKLNNIIFLRKQVTVEELKRLSNCEHFDVIFAFNILHHFKNDWKTVVDIVLDLGDHVIIELPSYAKKELQEYVAKKAPLVLGKFNRMNGKHLGIMRYYHNKKTRITSRSYGEISRDVKYEIKSDFYSKKIIKKTLDNKVILETDWKPGINLCTFKALNGVWPKLEIIKSELLSLSNKLKIGFAPSDIIVQGSKLEVIPSAKYSKLDLNKCIEQSLNFINI